MSDLESLKSKALKQEFFDGKKVFAYRDFFLPRQVDQNTWGSYLESLGFKKLAPGQNLIPQSFWPPTASSCSFLPFDSESQAQSSICSVASLSPTAQNPSPQLIGVAWVLNSGEKKALPLLFRGNPLRPSPWISTGFQSLFHLKERTPLLFDPVKLRDVPFACLQTILTTEDKKFLEHKGIDYWGIARAFIANLQSRKLAQGGSTLTQQYIKNAFLTSEKTIGRKIKEARLSLWLEEHLTKDEILERYLNVIYFGNIGHFEIRGIGAASQLYFDLPISQLGWSQCLVLAAVLKGPNQFHPSKKSKALENRYRALLEALITDKVLKPEDKLGLQNVPPVVLNLKSQTIQNAASYLASVKDLPDEQELFLALVPDMQNHIQKITSDYIKKINPALEASLVVIHRQSGHILTLINGKDPARSPYPRSTKAKRQIGSLIKPFIFYQYFLTYPHNDITTVINDEPIEIRVAKKIWTPQNHDKKFKGAVSLEYALSNSLNIPAVKLGLELPYSTWFYNQTHPALLLGAIEMSPLSISDIYFKIDQGRAARLTPFALEDQNIPVSGPTQTEETARDKVWASLKTAAISGTSKSIGLHPILSQRAFGKTGTTSGFRDTWFAGFLPDYLIVVWVGADDNTNVQLTGSTGALPLFLEAGRYLEGQAVH